jgi:hypothetical protein
MPRLHLEDRFNEDVEGMTTEEDAFGVTVVWSQTISKWWW